MENQTIRTYKLRRGRFTQAQAAAIAEHAELLLADGPVAFIEPYSHHSVRVLEIGFGMGEATVATALREPEVGVIAADLHTPGIGKLISELVLNEINSVRVVEADALELLYTRFPQDFLDGLRIFFPDPWPKARHHKRRLLTATNATELAKYVKAGGFLHLSLIHI